MKKIFIGLLILAAGTGVYFLLRKKDKPLATTINKEWVLGKWVLQSTLPVADSTFMPYRYEFLEKGLLVRTTADTAAADTLHYEWNKADQLVWKQSLDDSTSNVFTIERLTRDTLQARSADSVAILLTRVK